MSKLEPLPPLLRDFDLDSHVGLIQKLLKEDPKLEERQSVLSGKCDGADPYCIPLLGVFSDICHFLRCTIQSGGGPREKIFWQNYFFHCAFTRYEAGLSIDEIWSFQPETASTEGDTTAGASTDAPAEETVVFDEGGDTQSSSKSEHPAFAADEISAKEGAIASESSLPTSVSADGLASSGSPAESAVSEFELLDNGEIDVGTGDPELDELEAEIARELES